MSGGHFNYQDERLLGELYGWDTTSEVATVNPYENVVVSQLMYDLLKLTHDLDWYKSGDTCEEDYKKSLQVFRKKWLNSIASKTIETIVNKKIATLRDELMETIRN